MTTVYHLFLRAAISCQSRRRAMIIARLNVKLDVNGLEMHRHAPLDVAVMCVLGEKQK